MYNLPVAKKIFFTFVWKYPSLKAAKMTGNYFPKTS